MSTTLPIDKLTNKELVALGKSLGMKNLPDSPKALIIDALVAGGVTDDQFAVELVKQGHIDSVPDAPPAPQENASDAPTAPTGDAPTGTTEEPPAAPTAPAPDADEDDDPFVTEGNGAPVAEAAPLPVLEARHLAKLKDLGCRIRKITRHTHPNGENPGTWWCPFTDSSKLIANDEQGDQMPQSGAIRIDTGKLDERGLPVAYAVILPPEGLPKNALR